MSFISLIRSQLVNTCLRNSLRHSSTYLQRINPLKRVVYLVGRNENKKNYYTQLHVHVSIARRSRPA